MFQVGNKYNSLTETFVSDAPLNSLLSTLATPPADLSLDNGDFTAQQIYVRGGVGGANSRYGKWEINDMPRLLGYGIFCNLADGLVWSDDTAIEGLSLALSWAAYDAANLVTQADFTGSGATGNPSAPTFFARINALNMIHPADFRWDFSALTPGQDHFRGNVAIGAPSGANFSTISINPDFAAKRIIFWPLFVFEHSTSVRGVAF